MVKEVAASHQLLATFMGKPFNNVTGSGYHLHLSLVDDQEANRIYDRKQPDSLSEIMKYFIGGIIAHAPALMAFYWKLDPGQEVVGNAASGDASSISLPRSLEQSLTYLRQDEILCDLIGKPLVNAYTAMKEAELERFRTYVTDWEFNEYAFHL
jgi:glutamine synthetase